MQDADFDIFIQEKQNKLKKNEDSLKAKLEQGRILERSISRMEQKEEHPYANKKEIVSNKIDQLDRLQQYFERTLEGYYSDLYKGDSPKDDKQKEYNKSVFRFVGRTIGSIRTDKSPQGKEIDYYDCINKIFHFIDGQERTKNDISTGQAEQGYLKSRLNSIDNKPIIG